jgi:hypothetical protein
MKSIEGSKERFLGLFLTLQELDVINQKNINLTVLGLEIETCVGLNSVDEVIRKNFAGYVTDLFSRPVLLNIVSNGVK